MAQRVGRGIQLLFHDRGTRRGRVVSSTPWPLFTPREVPVSILQEAGWAPGLVWTGGKSRPHRNSIPDHQARSSVAISTEIPGLSLALYIYIKIYKIKNKSNIYEIYTVYIYIYLFIPYLTHRLDAKFVVKSVLEYVVTNVS